jgi:hypothetical protein
MPQAGVSIFEDWRQLAKLIVEERDEETQEALMELLRYSYREQMLKLSRRHELN